ncbi:MULTISPECIES: IclR family transcriptional regulator [unclassified Leucobacter]|uniref:IclR family transcriptional regulator n=1 Tax=unclassified Leucobacter TaxID=2621730 RepID=UPI00165D7B27|nr:MULTISPECIES: IclR family transcriptional regulator [unclassified Leucobacter]MBC9936521.1 IclR family transcriptional regulator [Leucobacter sp. cx-87]
MKVTHENPSAAVKSVDRVLDLLEVLASAGGRLAIGDIAQRTGIPLPSTHRLLRGLVSRGYVRQLPDRHYALGFRMVPLGRAANNFVGLNIESVLNPLVQTLGESVSLAILSNDKAEFIAQAVSPLSIRHTVELGKRVELYSTSVGKALLGLLPDSEVEASLKNLDFISSTEHTITDMAVLLADVRLSKKRGYALDRQESEAGLVSVAAAAKSEFDTHLAIALSGPLSRMTESKIAQAVPLLQAATQQLCSRQSESVLAASTARSTS